MDYSTNGPAGQAYFRLAATPFTHGSAEAVIVHTDITEFQLSRQDSLKRLQEFARRLIHAQEEERARIAREIHDDLGNRIALLSFSFHRLMNRWRANDSMTDQANEVLQRVNDLSLTLRQLSHGLHPHLLRHAGIGAALKVLGEEMSQTMGIPVKVRFPEELPYLSDDAGLCIYRVSQECLQNVAKHAKASEAAVILETAPGGIELTVSDGGCGFVPEIAASNGGLGLTSIRERVMCIGGQLEIVSAPGAGATIRVTIPLIDESSRELRLA
jgi:two-component system sensor histidine kinase UhpB